MFEDIAHFYEGVVKWYDQLWSFYQNTINAIILGLAVWVGRVLLRRVITPVWTRIRKTRHVGQVMRYAVHKYAVRNQDVRYGIDGLYFLVAHSLMYFFLACILVSSYWGIVSIARGDILGFIIAVSVILCLREAYLWVDKPSDKQIKAVDPALKGRVLEMFHSIDYDTPADPDDGGPEQPNEQ